MLAPRQTRRYPRSPSGPASGHDGRGCRRGSTRRSLGVSGVGSGLTSMITPPARRVTMATPGGRLNHGAGADHQADLGLRGTAEGAVDRLAERLTEPDDVRPQQPGALGTSRQRLRGARVDGLPMLPCRRLHELHSVRDRSSRASSIGKRPLKSSAGCRFAPVPRQSVDRRAPRLCVAGRGFSRLDVAHPADDFEPPPLRAASA